MGALSYEVSCVTYPPGLNHGGPGRAGGGSELGGRRGMEFYTQRTVVQGNGPLLARFLGVAVGE